MISIIICSIDAERFQAITAHYHHLFGNEPFEIVGIHDARSLAEGYRRGMVQAKGDILLFSHDDIEFWTPHFVPRLKNHLKRFDVVGLAGTNLLVRPRWIAAGPPNIFGQVAHPSENEYQIVIYGVPARIVPGIQAMDGLFLAFHRRVIEQVGWNAETFDGFHLYDLDCTYRAYQAGFRLGVATDLPVFHQSIGQFDETWKKYATLFMNQHGSTLAPMPVRKMQLTAVQVSEKAEAIRLMQVIADSTTPLGGDA